MTEYVHVHGQYRAIQSSDRGSSKIEIEIESRVRARLSNPDSRACAIIEPRLSCLVVDVNGVLMGLLPRISGVTRNGIENHYQNARVLSTHWFGDLVCLEITKIFNILS